MDTTLLVMKMYNLWDINPFTSVTGIYVLCRGAFHDRVQRKMRYPMTKIGSGTPKSHQIPYFSELLLAAARLTTRRVSVQSQSVEVTAAH